MKVGSLKSLFAELGQFVSSRGAHKDAGMVRDLGPLFEGHENKNVGDFANSVGRWRGTLGRTETSASLRMMQSLLQEFESLLRLSSALKAANDVNRVASLFDGCRHESVAAFVADARAGLDQTARRKKSPASRLRVDIVRSYSDELTATSQNNAAFDAVIARLKSDTRTVRALEMEAIADRYLGYDARLKKRGEALRAIQDRQLLDARHAAKKHSHRAITW